MMRPSPYSAHFPTVSGALPEILAELLRQPERSSRNGSIRELTNTSITIEHPSARYVTTPGRAASVGAQAAETMWVLAGRDDIGWLSKYLKRAADFSDDGEHWYGAYGPRLRRWSTTSKAHGERPIGHDKTVDQLADVVELLREKNDTRRAVVSLWDPAADDFDLKDIPCNDWLCFHPAGDGVLDLHVAIRSNDIIWGWSGINTFEWSVLLDLVATLAGYRTGRITYAQTSLHLYETHYKKAERIIGLADAATGWTASEPRPRRTLAKGLGVSTTIEELDELLTDWFEIESMIGRAPLREVTREIDSFPEGEFQDWLYAIQYLRSGSTGYLHALAGRPDIQTAVLQSPKLPDLPEIGTVEVDITPNLDALRKASETIAKMTYGPVYVAPAGSDEWKLLGTATADGIETSWNAEDGFQTTVNVEEPEHDHFEEWPVDRVQYEHPGVDDRPKPFWEFAADLHEEKHAAYGPSWKKRGEMLGIMANVARKVDRLGANGAGETSADTALDLLVYLIKYRLWLTENAEAPLPRGIWPPAQKKDLTDDPRYVRELLAHLGGRAGRLLDGTAAETRRIEEIRRRFDELEPLVEEKRDDRWGEVEHLIQLTYPLAVRLYSEETGWTPTPAERNATRSWNPEADDQ